MMRISHRFTSLSIGAFALMAATAATGATPAPYFGRWTVDEKNPVYSSRGLLYKTIDIARCGSDFCGVSVGKSGACGPVLFRFHAKRAADEDMLRGHGLWGQQKKNVTIEAYQAQDIRGGRGITINLGDGYDFSERSGNMPKFRADYRPLGNARCAAR